MNGAAVAGQDPLEAVVEEALHGPDLLGPGVPAGAPKRVEMAPALAPGQVIAGEEVRLAIEENRMTPGVTGRRNHEQVIADGDRIAA